MEWKNEGSPERLLLPFLGLLDGADNLGDQYAIGLRGIRVSALPDHYEKAYPPASGTPDGLLEKQDSGAERVTDALQK